MPDPIELTPIAPLEPIDPIPMPMIEPRGSSGSGSGSDCAGGRGIGLFAMFSSAPAIAITADSVPAGTSIAPARRDSGGGVVGMRCGAAGGSGGASGDLPRTMISPDAWVGGLLVARGVGTSGATGGVL